MRRLTLGEVIDLHRRLLEATGTDWLRHHLGPLT
jgi:hypothetical protein